MDSARLIPCDQDRLKKKKIKALEDKIPGPIKLMQMMMHHKVKDTETFFHLGNTVWTTHTVLCVLSWVVLRG